MEGKVTTDTCLRIPGQGPLGALRLDENHPVHPPLSSRHPGARGSFPFLAPLWKVVPRCLLLHSPSLRLTQPGGVGCPGPPRPASAEGQVGLGAPESEQQRGGTQGGSAKQLLGLHPARPPGSELTGASLGVSSMPAPPPTPQRRSIEMWPQKRLEADAASTFHPLHPGLMLNGAVFLSELSGPSATPRGEMTAPSSPQLQGRTQGGGRTHSVLRLSWGGSWVSTQPWLGGVDGGRRGVCRPPPSAGRTEAPQGRGVLGAPPMDGRDGPSEELGALQRRWALPARPPFHARRGIRAPEARCRCGLVLRGTVGSHSSQHCWI